LNVGKLVRFAALKVGAAVNPGAAEPPVKFPNTVFAAALESENVSAGVVVAVATDDVNSGERFPALNVVTVPEPPLVLPDVANQVFEPASNWNWNTVLAFAVEVTVPAPDTLDAKVTVLPPVASCWKSTVTTCPAVGFEKLNDDTFADRNTLNEFCPAAFAVATPDTMGTFT
jgi:hypothetical protein